MRASKATAAPPSASTASSSATDASSVLLVQLTSRLHDTNPPSTAAILDGSAACNPSAAAHKQLRIAFDHVGCALRRTTHRRHVQLLADVSGVISPFDLLAVMGPSGSGKTTLLRILSGKLSPTSGTVLYNGIPATQHGRQYLARAVGYVQQHPALLASLTLREMLCYSASLTSASMPAASRRAAIEAVPALLDLLGLTRCASTPCGQLSGGEAKRAAIGVVLLGSPKLLLLDEPLSGLDSSSAAEVCKLMRDLCTHGMAVAASLHQPSDTLFANFATLLVLAGGRLAYFGPQAAAVPYMTAKAARVWLLTDLPCFPVATNSEWLLAVIDSMKGRAEELAQAFSASPLGVALAAQITLEASPKAVVVSQPSTDGTQALRHSCMLGGMLGAVAASVRRLVLLLRYRGLSNLKSPTYWLSRGSNMLATAFVLSTVFWGVGDNPELDTTFNALSCLFMLVFAPSTVALAQSSTIFDERQVFAREYADGLYTSLEYLVALTTADNFVIMTAAVLSTAIIQACVRLRGSFLITLASVCLTLAAGTNLALLTVALCHSNGAVQATLPPFVGLATLFCGFTIPQIEEVPAWWRWFPYVDYLRYAWQAHVINYFGEDTVPSTTDALRVPATADALRAVQAVGGSMAGALASLDGSSTGAFVLHFFGMDGLGVWSRLGLQLAFVPVFGLMAWAALTWAVVRRR